MGRRDKGETRHRGEKQEGMRGLGERGKEGHVAHGGGTEGRRYQRN